MITRTAMVLTDFGDTDNMRRTELPVPKVRRRDDIVVRVRATSVNPIEWKMRQGLGLPKPVWRRLLGSPMILGLDFSGEVVAAGAAAGFRPGDEVMGALPIGGSYTSHLRLRTTHPRTSIVPKPSESPHATAALVPFAGLVAYAGLRTYGGLSDPAPGARILVVGASGGVGHLAVQMASHALGASHVVGVCSSRNAEFVRRCGAHEVVAHDRVAVRNLAGHLEARSYDLIFDCVGVDEYFTHVAPAVLRPGGRFVTAALPSAHAGRPGEDVPPAEAARLLGRLLRRRVTAGYRLIPGLLTGLPGEDGLPAIARWMADGTLAPHTAATYRLDDIGAAHRESETGRTVGKISVMVD